jgi:hypothetical protein
VATVNELLLDGAVFLEQPWRKHHTAALEKKLASLTPPYEIVGKPTDETSFFAVLGRILNMDPERARNEIFTWLKDNEGNVEVNYGF